MVCIQLVGTLFVNLDTTMYIAIVAVLGYQGLARTDKYDADQWNLPMDSEIHPLSS